MYIVPFQTYTSRVLLPCARFHKCNVSQTFPLLVMPAPTLKRPRLVILARCCIVPQFGNLIGASENSNHNGQSEPTNALKFEVRELDA
jgi:hypothetical protein